MNSVERDVLLIAHRGASAEAPESTRAAIRRAVARRVDMIELDVQVTRDGRLVIFHDDRLERTTTGSGRLAGQPYARLARLDAGSWWSPRFAGERVLLASQALRLIPPPVRINLELKRTPQPAVLVHRLARCLRWTRTASRVLVSSFDAALVARMRRAAPDVARALLCRRRPRASLCKALRLGCVAWHPHASLLNPRVIDEAHAAGLRVHTWTVDEPAQARRLLAMGVDGIVTNRPDRLRAVCHRGGVG